MNYSLTNEDITAYQNKLANEQAANENKANEQKRVAADMQSTVLNALSMPTNQPSQPIQNAPVEKGSAWNGQ